MYISQVAEYNTFMKTKQIKDGKWVYAEATNPLKDGDTIEFTCNGKGRGGHYNVTALVTKVMPKKIWAIEANGSYRPGTLWTLPLNAENLYVKL